MSKEETIRRYISQHPHEIGNELKGDGISNYGKHDLLALGVDLEIEENYVLFSQVCEDMKTRI